MKKSASVFTAEKYACEIEILNLRRGFRAEISHSSELKRRFHRSMFRHFWKTDFFNRIGRFLPVARGRKRPIVLKKSVLPDCPRTDC
ncbi:hypothetical protein DJ564_17645 [Pseudomonas sp. 31-12]|nr:hypothetical protein DJ564_17645 [Pseudomonas sp. 31-12]